MRFDVADEFVAQFKFTVLLMPNGIMQVTGLPFLDDQYQSEHFLVDEELKVCSTSQFYSGSIS